MQARRRAPSFETVRKKKKKNTHTHTHTRYREDTHTPRCWTDLCVLDLAWFDAGRSRGGVRHPLHRERGPLQRVRHHQVVEEGRVLLPHLVLLLHHLLLDLVAVKTHSLSHTKPALLRIRFATKGPVPRRKTHTHNRESALAHA